MVCRGSGPICRAKLGGGASSQTQGPLETFFWGMEELDVAETLCWELLYIYIYYLVVFLVDVKLWMC